jgi:acyl-CoA thioester hydrolase
MKPPQLSDIVAYHAEPMRVPFRDVDGWGLVWHGHYFSYVDAARIALLKKFAIPFRDFPALGFVMPIVRCDIEIKSPSAADDALKVEVAIVAERGAIVDTVFRMSLQSAEASDRLVCRGYTRQVFTTPDGRLLYHIPEPVADGFARLTQQALGR